MINVANEPFAMMVALIFSNNLDHCIFFILEALTSWKQRLKLHFAYLPNFFSIWTRVLNNNKYVEIKQFSKVDIKQNNISTFILLIKFLVYQWDPRHLQESRVVYIFIYTLYSCSIWYLITFLCILIIRIHVNLIISDVHKELSNLRMKNSNRKYKLRTGLFIAWINRWGHILIRYLIYK